MEDVTGIQYIVFGYVSTWGLEQERPLAVLTLPRSAGSERLYTAPDWKAHVPEDAAPLIGETLADWESLSRAEAVRLFPHLAQASAGSFQALESGTYPEAELSALLEGELGIRGL